MKDYSSLAKMGRDAAISPIPIYANSIIDKYHEILGTIIERRIRQEAAKEWRKDSHNNDIKVINELY